MRLVALLVLYSRSAVGAYLAPSALVRTQHGAAAPPPLRSSAPLRSKPPLCSDVDEAERAAERAETLEYFKTLGGFSFGSFGLFVALTAGAGLDDQAAGNLVLVALCIYGSYLLFFDGGVTQAALEAQAVQQLADEEGDIMAAAPRATVVEYPAAVDPEALAQTLDDDGFARVNSILSSETASALLEHVNSELGAKREAVKAGKEAESRSFGDVLSRENRFDLKLDLKPPVQAALTEALQPLQPALSRVLGEEAELFELAALVSDPRSPRQPVHPDTPYREGLGAAVITAFVALQDVEVDMGPTSIVPGTNTEEAHVRFNSADDGGREKVALLREKPNHVGTLGTVSPDCQPVTAAGFAFAAAAGFALALCLAPVPGASLLHAPAGVPQLWLVAVAGCCGWRMAHKLHLDPAPPLRTLA